MQVTENKLRSGQQPMSQSREWRHVLYHNYFAFKFGQDQFDCFFEDTHVETGVVQFVSIAPINKCFARVFQNVFQPVVFGKRTWVTRGNLYIVPRFEAFLCGRRSV